MVGYKFTNNLVAGVGLGYQYNQQPDLNFSNPYYSSTVYYDKENIVYPNLWAKYTVWRILYIGTQLEYDLIHLNEPALDINGYQITANVNVNATCWLVGALCMKNHKMTLLQAKVWASRPWPTML